MAISADELVRRNAAFAATGAFAGLPFPTSDTLQVLGFEELVRAAPGDVGRRGDLGGPRPGSHSWPM